MLCHKHSKMLSLRPLAFLIIPVFDCTNYMGFISFTKHYLDFIHRVVFRILKENIKPATGRLLTLLRDGLEFTESEAYGIFDNLILQPVFVKSCFSKRNRLSNLYLFRHFPLPKSNSAPPNKFYLTNSRIARSSPSSVSGNIRPPMSWRIIRIDWVCGHSLSGTGLSHTHEG